MAEELQNHEAVATPEHQLLMDRFKSLFQGALDYVENHLPNHPNLKDDVKNSIRAAWDNSAAIIKGEADTEFQRLKAQGEEAAQGALAAGEQIATEAASGIEQAAGAVVESNTPSAPATGGAPSGADSSAADTASADTPTAK